MRSHGMEQERVIDGNDVDTKMLVGWYIRLMKSAMNRDEGFLPSDYDYLIRMVRTGKARQIAMSIMLLSNIYFF